MKTSRPIHFHGRLNRHGRKAARMFLRRYHTPLGAEPGIRPLVVDHMERALEATGHAVQWASSRATPIPGEPRIITVATPNRIGSR